MITVRATKKLNFEFNGYKFSINQGEELLFAEDVFKLLPEQIRESFKQTSTKLPPIYEGENLNGKTIFVFMQGAIGDVLCSTVALRELKRRYPRAKLRDYIIGTLRVCSQRLKEP